MGSNSIVTNNREDEDDDVPLPGFRFHPTDEELVGFYLRRKVDKRPISIELIKQIDIYKYDPWDLPKASNVGDKEWYFFCKRGRKYRNSIRPNRVTGSGFWKATGIDRPIYSAAGGEGRDCIIGLKKSLVYYRGSAGKGTKTDWMMHEFRLPADHDKTTSKHSAVDPKTMSQEAEVWTLCRIFKRNVSYRKCIPNWTEMTAKRNNNSAGSSGGCSGGGGGGEASSKTYRPREGYISFTADAAAGSPVSFRHNMNYHEKKPTTTNTTATTATSMQAVIGSSSSSSGNGVWSCGAPSTAVISSYSAHLNHADLNVNDHHLINKYDWDELRSVVDFGIADPLFM